MDTNKKPFYKKTWVIIVTILILVIIANIAPKQEKNEVVIPYDKMTTKQQEVYLNNFVSVNRMLINNKIEESIKQEVKAPSQTDFNDDVKFFVDQYVTKQIRATGTIESPNSFGVKMHIGYRCLFSIINDNGDIEIKKLVIDE